MVDEDSTAKTSHLFGKQLVRRLFAPVVLAVVAYAALLLYGDVPSVSNCLQGLRPKALAAALGVSIASFALRGLRWQLYLRAARIRVPWADSALVFVAGLGMSITPGKVGELLKSLLLKERHEVPVANSAPVVVAERAMDFAALLLLGGGSLGWARSPRLVLLLGALFIATLFFMGRSRRVGLLATRLLNILPFARRYSDKIAEARSSLELLWGFGPFFMAMLLSILAWGLQALTVSIFASALDGRDLPLQSAFIAYAAPLLAGALALLPGGLGVTEASMAGSLRVMSGMSSRSAVAITILTRLVTFWFAVLIGFAALAIWRIRSRSASQS